MSVLPEPDVLVARRSRCLNLGYSCGSTKDHSKSRQSLEQTRALHVETQRDPSFRPSQRFSGGIDPDSTLEGIASYFLDTNTDSHDPSSNPENSGWSLDPGLGAQLIELFFEKVQCWLPIIHRPKFAARFIRRAGETATVVDRSTVSDVEAFLMYGIFALGARFSRSPYFDKVPPVDQGQKYASHAATTLDCIFKTHQEPSVEFLQGCIMLAVYHLMAGHAGPGFALTSVCVRFAFALSLNEIDAELMNEDGTLNTESFEESAGSWVRKEQLRRLWWATWELEIYMATLSCQPSDIERRIRVLLPVPDCDWIRGIPVKSAFIHHRPESVWTSLRGSSNQSPRAWFLLANYLKSCMSVPCHHLPEITTSTKSSLETALCNFKLSLPAEFQLRSLFVNNQNYEEANWVISTHLIIVACETLLESSRRPSGVRHDVDSPTSAQDTGPFARRMASYLVNVAQVWPPEYIPLNHPMVCCAVILPASIATQQCESTARAQEVAGLILSHYAKYWAIGSEMLQLLTAVRQPLKTVDQYSDHLPTILRQASSVGTSAKYLGQFTFALNSLRYSKYARQPLEVTAKLGEYLLAKVPLSITDVHEIVATGRQESANSEADFGLGNRISLY
ncbi:hypothetical protein AYL99_01035 [Fonsecaea erecta]|uniref:Xylanolytic transcriptional activator regulatory domain-containing protein n=1 Tax=Fonsecaea erecta TaxID=1367422 RepID=A0A179A0V8_9EURO|nr:hypothetical protein AYL99_01035 [Fonsecaea erecta]OAP65063.1 hypothetical protein AYL99_01035 [Fonsecaea erecta]